MQYSSPTLNDLRSDVKINMYIIVIWDAYLKIITQRRLMGARLQWREKRTSNSNVNPQEQRKRTINSSKKANITSSIHTRVCVCVCVYGSHSIICVRLCDPMDCSLPGSPVHGILQARIVEWVVIPFSRGSSQPRNWTWVSHLAGRFFTIWALGKPLYIHTLD